MLPTIIDQNADKFSVPAIVSEIGEHASEKFLELFFATIRNPNTRQTYARAVMQCLTFLENRGRIH